MRLENFTGNPWDHGTLENLRQILGERTVVDVADVLVASSESRKRGRSVIPASDDEDDEEPISMLERRQQPRRNKANDIHHPQAPSISATTVYTGAIMCDHPDQHRTQIDCVTAAMADLRIEYTTFYNSYCSVTQEDRCVTLFPVVYWWAPLIPLLQRFDHQLQQGSDKSYWGRHAFGCKHHRKDMWEVPLLFPWVDGELEDWLWQFNNNNHDVYTKVHLQELEKDEDCQSDDDGRTIRKLAAIHQSAMFCKSQKSVHWLCGSSTIWKNAVIRDYHIV